MWADDTEVKKLQCGLINYIRSYVSLWLCWAVASQICSRQTGKIQHLNHSLNLTTKHDVLLIQPQA